jgi:hypothetical protein
MPYDKKPSAVAKMYDKKGKQTGLMMEGSVAHMESALQHAGKSKLHAKPEKDYPDDGHLHYQDGKKVESPGVSETRKLSDTSGAVGQMSPYKFTGMSGGSAMYKTDPPNEGVTVTGDASKIGGVTSTAKERRQEEIARKKEALRIKTANKRMEAELARETKKAEAGERKIQAQQKLREKQGKDYMTSEGVVVRRR